MQDLFYIYMYIYSYSTMKQLVVKRAKRIAGFKVQ
jgi:hypothetical protein